VLETTMRRPNQYSSKMETPVIVQCRNPSLVPLLYCAGLFARYECARLAFCDYLVAGRMPQKPSTSSGVSDSCSTVISATRPSFSRYPRTAYKQSHAGKSHAQMSAQLADVSLRNMQLIK
jgi:hypothetical protein